MLLYPVFVDPNVIDECEIGVLGNVTFMLTEDVAELFEGWVNQLNNALVAQVGAWAGLHPDADAQVVATATAFAGHELCSDDPTDVNGLMFDAKNKPSMESFHPTATGHMKLADAVIASVGPRANDATERAPPGRWCSLRPGASRAPHQRDASGRTKPDLLSSVDIWSQNWIRFGTV